MAGDRWQPIVPSQDMAAAFCDLFMRCGTLTEALATRCTASIENQCREEMVPPMDAALKEGRVVFDATAKQDCLATGGSRLFPVDPCNPNNSTP